MLLSVSEELVLSLTLRITVSQPCTGKGDGEAWRGRATTHSNASIILLEPQWLCLISLRCSTAQVNEAEFPAVSRAAVINECLGGSDGVVDADFVRGVVVRHPGFA